MLYHMCEESKRPPTWPQLEHAIKRNFSGLESEELNPFEEFSKLIPMSGKWTEEVCELDLTQCSKLYY